MRRVEVHRVQLVLLLAAVVVSDQVPDPVLSLASERTSIERTYELTKYLEHQLREIKDTYLSYLGPPFSDPDFSPPRPNTTALSLPSAATRLDLWRGLENRARLAQNHRAYSVLLGAVRELAKATLCPYLQSSLLHFSAGLDGLLGSISGLMTTLGYALPPQYYSLQPATAPAPNPEPLPRHYSTPQNGKERERQRSREGERTAERERGSHKDLGSDLKSRSDVDTAFSPELRSGGRPGDRAGQREEREREEKGRRGQRWEGGRVAGTGKETEEEPEEEEEEGEMEGWGRRRRLLSMLEQAEMEGADSGKSPMLLSSERLRDLAATPVHLPLSGQRTRTRTRMVSPWQDPTHTQVLGFQAGSEGEESTHTQVLGFQVGSKGEESTHSQALGFQARSKGEEISNELRREATDAMGSAPIRVNLTQSHMAGLLQTFNSNNNNNHNDNSGNHLDDDHVRYMERDPGSETKRGAERGGAREDASLFTSSSSLHQRRSRSLPSSLYTSTLHPPLSPLSLFYQFGAREGHTLLSDLAPGNPLPLSLRTGPQLASLPPSPLLTALSNTPLLHAPSLNDFSRKVESFWVLRELQSWLWRSAKDFNRLKKRLRA